MMPPLEVAPCAKNRPELVGAGSSTFTPTALAGRWCHVRSSPRAQALASRARATLPAGRHGAASPPGGVFDLIASDGSVFTRRVVRSAVVETEPVPHKTCAAQLATNSCATT
jgi:hypothetical protein